VCFQAIVCLPTGKPARRARLVLGEDLVHLLGVRRQTTAVVAGGVCRFDRLVDLRSGLARVHRLPHGAALLPMYLLMASRKK
jgi:hypothetical protein